MVMYHRKDIGIIVVNVTKLIKDSVINANTALGAALLTQTVLITDSAQRIHTNNKILSHCLPGTSTNQLMSVIEKSNGAQTHCTCRCQTGAIAGRNQCMAPNPERQECCQGLLYNVHVYSCMKVE